MNNSLYTDETMTTIQQLRSKGAKWKSISRKLSANGIKTRSGRPYDAGSLCAKYGIWRKEKQTPIVTEQARTGQTTYLVGPAASDTLLEDARHILKLRSISDHTKVITLSSILCG